jgi:hypothetical protein
MSSETQAAKFGFKVEFRDAYPHDEDDAPGWLVSLPHQCDRWDIVGSVLYGGKGWTTACETLQQFIDEATEALTALRQQQEFGDR